MSKITVAEVFQGPALAPGVTVTSVAVIVTDASGAPQSVTLNGSEASPWSVSLTVAPGAGKVDSTPTLSDGSTGLPVTQAYDTGSTGTVSLGLSGTTVNVDTP